MRLNDRVPCLACIDYREGDVILVARCQKDGRHGHGRKRQSFLYHRADVLMKNGDRAQVRWSGKGIMPKEVAARRALQQEAWLNRKRLEGELTWDGHECQ